MKVNTKQSAELFYELTADKSPGEVKDVVKKFVELLAKNGYLGKVDKVIGEFEKIWNEKRGIVEAEITSARELDKEIVKSLHNHIIKLSGAKEIVLTEKVDKKILGGVVIRHGDRVVDGSLRTRVGELKNKMIK